MKCPTCLENFNADEESDSLFSGYRDGDGKSYRVITTECSNKDCRQRIIFLDITYHPDNTGVPQGMANRPTITREMLFPKSIARPNVVLNDIPDAYKEDYQESVEVFPISPKASAALTRRILQTLLRQEAGVKHSSLSDEIGTVVDSGELSSRIIKLLDAVREIGNFAAHPIKSTNTGEIVNVEPGEAELNLDVVETLFDHYFTAPKIQQQRIDEINKKLADAGKPSLENTLEKRQAIKDKQKLKQSKINEGSAQNLEA